MAAYNQVTIYSSMSRSEKEMNNLFNGFSKQLYEQKWKMFQDINNWQGTQNRLIDDHAYEQKRLLEREYQKQISYLEGSRNQFINASRPYELKGDNDQIDQLLVQCSALKCELAALESSERTIRFIHFMTEEQIAQKKRNERKTERVDDSKFRNKTGEDYDNYHANDTGARGSSPSKITSSTFKENNTPISTRNQGSGDHNRSNSNNDNSNRTGKGDDGSISKCPTCFMIFPGHMTSDDRNRHAAEHYADS